MVEQVDDLPEKVCYSTKLQQTLALEGSPVGYSHSATTTAWIEAVAT